MATRTAGAGSTTWTAAAFSGGSATVAADEVVVPTGATLTISAANTVLCRSISVTGTGTLVFAATTSVANIGDATAGTGNVALSVASGATITLTGVGTINFVSTSATQQTITTNGKTLGIINVNGIGSSYVLGSALTLATSGTFNIANGIFDTANFAMTMSSFNINNGTKTLTLGSSAITLTTGGSAWATNFFTNLTITTNTAVVTLTAVIANANTIILGAVDWKGLSFVVSAGGQMNINQSGATIKSFTFTGRNAKTDFVGLNGSPFGNLTLTGTLTINGNSAINRVLFSSTQTRGTAITVNVPTTPTFSNVDFMDIVAGGASAPWNLSGITGRSGDAGGNSGITFTTPATQTNTGATGNWSDATKWTSRVPLPQDDVVINTGSGTITGDMPRLGKDINFTGFTGTYTSGINTEAYGSFTLFSSMTFTTVASYSLAGRGTHTFMSAGKNPSGSGGTVTFNGPGGGYTLQDPFISTGAVQALGGTLDTNNFNVQSLVFVSNSATTRSVILGTTTWTLTQTNATNVWNIQTIGMTMSAASSTIVIGTASANNRSFSTGTSTVGAYGILRYTVAGSTGSLQLTNNSNTFYDIEFSDSSNSRRFFTTGTILLNSPTPLINFRGTAGKLMTFDTNASGTARALTFAPGAIVSTDYLSIQDITVSTPLTFFAGANSTNVSGNQNIYFSAPGAYRYRQGAVAANVSSTTITATYLASTTAGNLLVAYFFSGGSQGATFNPPAGWTQAVTKTETNLAYIYYKIATGTETAVNFSQTTSRSLYLTISEYSGFTGTPTIDVTDSNSSVTSTTTLSTTTGAGPTNTAQPALAFAYLATAAGSLGNTNSVSNSFVEDKNFTSNNKGFVKELTTMAAVKTTITWANGRTSIPIVLVVFKDLPIGNAAGGFLPFF